MRRNPGFRDLGTCGVCGQPSEEHHDYVPTLWPIWCKCDPGDWGVGGEFLKKSCNGFTPDPEDEGRCKNCEHDRECHEAEEEGKP